MGRAACRPDLVCPTCLRPWPNVERPRVDLTENLFVCRRGTARLSPVEAELMYVLAIHAPAIVRHDTIRSAVWGLRESPDDEAATVQVMVSHVRRKIAGLGWSIRPLWGEGYKLAPTLGEPG